MSQLTIYLPEELHERVRARAKELGVSLSSFMAGLARKAVEHEQRFEQLDSLFGSCEGLVMPEDSPPRNVDF